MSKYTIKQIFTSNNAIYNFVKNYEAKFGKLRNAISENIAKILSCKNICRGFSEYRCSNKECHHIDRVFFTCKSKSCSSCGKKATEDWIKKQFQILPKYDWQHITFTMPDILWPLFWFNRGLLNIVPKLAAECVQTIAADKGAIPGIFIAIHTFGRDLKRNVHIHLSVMLGGLSLDHSRWIPLYFHQETLMKMWRYRIISMFRLYYTMKLLILSKQIENLINHTFSFNNLLDKLYNTYWHVHCAPATNSHKQNVEYLGKYSKKPPIAGSRLKHYDGNIVTIQYLDHNTKTNKYKTFDIQEFIKRFLWHIPDKYYRSIRYYGFLSNRLRGKLLKIVRKLLRLHEPKIPPPMTYQQRKIAEYGIDPFKCTLCNSQMLLSTVVYGITNTMQLVALLPKLMQLKKI